MVLSQATVASHKYNEVSTDICKGTPIYPHCLMVEEAMAVRRWQLLQEWMGKNRKQKQNLKKSIITVFQAEYQYNLCVSYYSMSEIINYWSE